MRGMVAMVVAGMALLSGCGVVQYRVSVRDDGVMAMPGAYVGPAVTIPGGIVYDPHTEKVTVLPMPEGEKNLTVSGMEWSSDGKRLLVVTWNQPEPQPKPEPVKGPTIAPPVTRLWVCDEKGKNWKELAGDASIVAMGHWSPDGKKVTFLSSDSALKMVDTESGEVTTVLEGALAFHAWEPGGNRLAVFRAELAESNGLDMVWMASLVTVSAGESAKAHATALVQGIPWVTWSNDGKSILFCAPKTQVELPMAEGTLAADRKRKLSEPMLFSMTVGSGETRQLSKKKILYAVESPDGKHIVFVESAGRGRTKVGVMNSDGRGARSLDEGVRTSENEVWAGVFAQPVWLSNTRVQYYQAEMVAGQPRGMVLAVDIDGKNKEDLGAKIVKLAEKVAGEQEKK